MYVYRKLIKYCISNIKKNRIYSKQRLVVNWVKRYDWKNKGLQRENEDIKQGNRYDCVEGRKNKQQTETRKDARTIFSGN